MLYRRKIQLTINTSDFSYPVISRDVLAECFKADQLLSHANDQAERLLNTAEEKCEAMRRQAELEFWERANSQLNRWSCEREELCANLEQHATSIVSSAIKHLLGETPEPQRLIALPKQLLKNQIPEISATLHCCPDEIEQIKHYFSTYRISQWKVQTDETIEPQKLVLKTEVGDFCISWNAMVENLLKHSEDC